MTRPAEALAAHLYPDQACRCLCRLNHPMSGAVCESLRGPAWSVPLCTANVDGVWMCAPCRDATMADRP